MLKSVLSICCFYFLAHLSFAQSLAASKKSSDSLVHLLLKGELPFVSLNGEQVCAATDVFAMLEQNEAAVQLIAGTLGNKEVYLASIFYKNIMEAPVYVVIENRIALDSVYYKEYYQKLIARKVDDKSYERYWGLIAEKLRELKPGGFSKVYLSMAGVYHKIGLLGLYDPVSQEYLIDLYNLRLLPRFCASAQNAANDKSQVLPKDSEANWPSLYGNGYENLTLPAIVFHVLRSSMYGKGYANPASSDRGTIAYLWETDAELRANFSSYFYSHFAKSRNKAEAYFAAIKKLRSERSQPYYWAGCVFIGK